MNFQLKAGTWNSAERAGPGSGGPPPAKPVPVLLKPSELVICREPCEVTTVLGSCVAVTMFAARLGLALMCHAMLPAPGQGRCAEDHSHELYKFVCFAIPAMAAAFKRADARPGEIQVKMFGGANLVGAIEKKECPNCVGPANIRMARLLILDEHLHIAAADVGGWRGRKILFNTGTGQVLHKHLGEWHGPQDQRGTDCSPGAYALAGLASMLPSLSNNPIPS